MARKAEQVGVCGLSWSDFERDYRLVWLSFKLFASVGFRGKSDEKPPRIFGFLLRLFFKKTSCLSCLA
jgi:hypothetical protein